MSDKQTQRMESQYGIFPLPSRRRTKNALVTLQEDVPQDNVPKAKIKILENKLQYVVKKFLHEKMSDVGQDVTIMVGSSY